MFGKPFRETHETRHLQCGLPSSEFLNNRCVGPATACVTCDVRIIHEATVTSSDQYSISSRRVLNTMVMVGIS